ncbi:MAG: hypothetical protein LBS54_06955 [Dysgonamonadaceae bacterium]|nr:hypothetical protein [Dysgonamonadaceae bacterium]
MNRLSLITKALCILLSVSCLGLRLHAQVSIGLATSPENAALLQLKDVEPAANTKNATATNGGLLLPRVELNSIDQFSLSGQTDNLPNKTGMLVYNINVDQGKNLEKGIYLWTGTEWEILRKITTTSPPAKQVPFTKKIIYQSTSADETRIISIGKFEFRLSGAYPQIRLAAGQSSQKYFLHLNRYWHDGAENAGYSFDSFSRSLTNGWISLNTMSNSHERNEIWLADPDPNNLKMYNVQFIIMHVQGTPNFYAIIAKEYEIVN